MRIAPVPAGRPRSRYRDTTPTVAPSISSSRDGRTPRASTSFTAPHAIVTSGKYDTAVLERAGDGRRASVTSVITPSVPSDPTKRCVRS